MLLIELRDFIKERQSVTLTELSWRFKMPESAVAGMMAHWVRKGSILEDAPVNPCGSGACKGCKEKCATVYRYCEATQKPTRSPE